jgi:hypothetical protein
MTQLKQSSAWPQTRMVKRIIDLHAGGKKYRNVTSSTPWYAAMRGLRRSGREKYHESRDDHDGH